MLLLPRDPDDGKDVILEIKAGEGGEESALFAGDLLRMYLRYAERRGWKTEVLDAIESDLGGYKDVAVAVKSRGAREPGDGVWARLKYEGGVHRVQRVPVTESQGRIHTSAAGVLVLPEAEDVEVVIDPNDLRIDVFRSSGPGRAERQHDRLRGADHAPARPASSCPARTRRASCRTSEQAMRILRARLLALAQEAADAEASAARAHARSAPSTAPSGSAPTTTRRTGSPTTGSGSRRTTSTRCSTASSTPVIQSAIDADEAGPARCGRLAVTARPTDACGRARLGAQDGWPTRACLAARRRRAARRRTCSVSDAGRAGGGPARIDRRPTAYDALVGRAGRARAACST